MALCAQRTLLVDGKELLKPIAPVNDSPRREP